MNQNPIFPFQYSDRKAMEKNRRDQMKALYVKLCSLLPHQSSKEISSMSDQLEEAAGYIKELQERLGVMKQKRNSLKMRKSAYLSSGSESELEGVKQVPVVEVEANGSNLNVVLITGIRHHYMFKETVRILVEEGADVVSAGFSLTDQTVFHTVYSEIGGSGLENEGARISERLKKFVADEY